MDASQRSILSYLKDLASLQPEKPLLGSDAHWLSAGKVLSLVEHVATTLVSYGAAVLMTRFPQRR